MKMYALLVRVLYSRYGIACVNQANNDGQAHIATVKDNRNILSEFLLLMLMCSLAVRTSAFSARSA